MKPVIKLIYMSFNPYHIPHGMAVLSSYLSNKFKVFQEVIKCYDTDDPLLLRFKIDGLKRAGGSVRKILYRKLSEIKKRSFENACLDYAIKGSRFPYMRYLDSIIQDLNVNNAEIIGFSLQSRRQLLAYLVIARRLNEKFRIPIVFGGPYVCLYNELINLRKFQFIDYLVTGTGEYPIVGLAGYLKGEQNINSVGKGKDCF